MFIDSLGLLSDAQAVTADAYSTNTIDLGNVTPKIDIGAGESMAIVLQVDVAADFTSANETYQFDFVQSANANLSSHDILESRVITAANLTAGSLHYITINPGAITKRYVGLQYDVGGTTPTITCTAFLQPRNMIQNSQIYADGITIS